MSDHDAEYESDVRIMLRHRDVSAMCAVAGHSRQRLLSGETMPCPYPRCPDNRGIGPVLYVAETQALRHMLRPDAPALDMPTPFISKNRYVAREHVPTGTRAWILDFVADATDRANQGAKP